MSENAANRVITYFSKKKPAEQYIYNYLQQASKYGISTQSQIIKAALELYIKNHPLHIHNQNDFTYKEDSFIESEISSNIYSRSEPKHIETRESVDSKQNNGSKEHDVNLDVIKSEDEFEKIKQNDVGNNEKNSEFIKEQDNTFSENEEIINNNEKSTNENNNPFIMNILKGMDDLMKAK